MRTGTMPLPFPGEESGRSKQRRTLEAFSRRELTTQQVTAKLGLDYGAVLDLLRDEALPRYRVPDDVARPMIDDLVALVRAPRG